VVGFYEHKSLRISWLAERLSVSQEVFCLIKSVNWLLSNRILGAKYC
jgi:hypothetical protein